MYTEGMNLFFYIVVPPFVLLLIAFAGLSWRSSVTQRRAEQQLFLAGKIPERMPDGLYQGSVTVQTTWQGKKFDAKNKTGINIFEEKEKTSEQYPFKTYVGKGLKDKKLDVIKIDYNVPGNLFWLRFVLDEIVQTEPGKFLGKLHFHFGPFAFALGYFELEK